MAHYGSLAKQRVKVDIFLKYILIAAVLITSIAFPVFQSSLYFRQLDRSEPNDIYKFWKQAYENIEENSSIYTHAFSENVGMFMDRYEYPDKNIDFYYSRSPGYSQENALRDFETGKNVYFVGKEAQFKFMFNAEKTGRIFFVSRYSEFLQLYRITSIFKSLEIDYSLDNNEKKFGEKFQIEFTIENKNPEPVQISSIELDLPGDIEFIDVDPEGYIDQGPGMSRGIYMWVSDDYIIDPDSKINLIVYLQGRSPGKSVIDFRITTHDIYIEVDEIEIEIK